VELVVQEENDYGMGSGELVNDMAIYCRNNIAIHQHIGRETPSHSHKVTMQK
jgi:hypothetical protein